jgi:hypothetical protein
MNILPAERLLASQEGLCSTDDYKRSFSSLSQFKIKKKVNPQQWELGSQQMLWLETILRSLKQTVTVINAQGFSLL